MNIFKRIVQIVSMSACAVAIAANVNAGVILQADLKNEEKIVNKGAEGKVQRWGKNSVEISHGILKVKHVANSSTWQAGAVLITPENVSTSWAAMYEDGNINGAVDFFVGSSIGLDSNSPANLLRVLDIDNRKRGGLRLIVMNTKASLRVEIMGPDNEALIMSNGQTTQTRACSAKTPMEPGKLYHVAITFETDDNDIVSCKLYFTTADMDITPGNDTPCKTIAFRLGESLKTGFSANKFYYGQVGSTKNIDYTNSFGRLTLYDAVPTVFPKQ